MRSVWLHSAVFISVAAPTAVVMAAFSWVGNKYALPEVGAMCGVIAGILVATKILDILDVLLSNQKGG